MPCVWQGVCVMGNVCGRYRQFLPELTKMFDVVLPLEKLVESNASNVAHLDHMRLEPLVYTENVLAHPITNGVKQVWYPTREKYQAADTGPLIVGPDWTVLLRGSPTTHTVAVNLSEAGKATGKALPPCATNTCKGRTPGVAAPALFAVRNFGNGRVAILNQWRAFTWGLGTHFYFDSQVLTRGVADSSSDMGRLLRNTLVWLGSSPKSSGLGGFVTPADRWQLPNDQPSVAEQFAEQKIAYNASSLDSVDPAVTDCKYGQKNCVKSWKGLVGARTSLSDGQGSVQDYAKAAKANHLDFIVFLETFAMRDNSTFSAASLTKLKADCAAHSDSSITLIPGFTIPTQFGGNQMM